MIKKAIAKIKSMFDLEDEEEQFEEVPVDDYYKPKKENSRPSLINLSSHRNKQEIMILEPVSYAETMQIADYIKHKKILIINLNKADKELAHHIMAFLQGACYVQDGHMENIAENIFLFTPSSIEIVLEAKRPKIKETHQFVNK
jgi:cell division inhibitor SepF